MPGFVFNLKGSIINLPQKQTTSFFVFFAARVVPWQNLRPGEQTVWLINLPPPKVSPSEIAGLVKG